MSRFLQHWRHYFYTATDAPMEYGEIGGLMALSTIALARRELAVGRGLRPNLFAMIVGDSSVARKSTSVGLCKSVVEHVEPHRVGPRDYTVEGLLKWMQEKNPATNKSRNKVTLFAEEFGSDLARMEAYAGTMQADMCGLYDGESFEKVRAMGAPIVVDKPRVSLFGAAAYNMMSRYLKVDDWLTGYLMRFVYVAPLAMRPQNLVQPHHPQQLYDVAWASLQNLNDDLTRQHVVMHLDQAAQQLYESWVVFNQQDVATKQDPFDILKTYLGRFQPNVLKLAMLYQIDEDPFAPVDVISMERALNFAEGVLWPSFLHAYERTTLDEFSGMMSSVLQALHEAGSKGVYKSALSRRFKSRIFRDVIEYLKWTNRVRVVAHTNGEELCSLVP